VPNLVEEEEDQSAISVKAPVSAWRFSLKQIGQS